MGVRAKMYNALTSLVGAPLSLISPMRAGVYRYQREAYRTYVAGEAVGANKNFRPRNRSADAEIAKASKLVLARARDQAQNNSYISGGVDKICNNVVRNGIRPQFCVKKSKNNSGKLDHNKNKQFEYLWKRWSRYADISRHDSFAGIQRLVLRHIWIDGEVLVHQVYDDSIKGIVPLRLEVIECDHLDKRVDGRLANGTIARRGIEYDTVTGRKLAYHVLLQHPGDNPFYQFRRGESRRIDAKDIIHIFDRRRASQTRGISWLASILMEAYNLAEYKTTEQIGARAAAAWLLFIKSNYPDMGGMVGSMAGDGAVPGSVSGPPAWGELPDYPEPGRIQGLPYGTEAQMVSHSRPGNQYEPYIRETVRGMSTGAGMSYEKLSNDYTSASYSSARSASLEERLSFGAQQTFLNEKLNDPVLSWFMTAAFAAGLAPVMAGYGFDPLPWHEAHTWQNPGWAWVDPFKDSAAVDKGIANVTTTRNRATAQKGDDWDEIVEEAVREEKTLSELYRLRAANQKIQENNNDPGTA